jgi:hypothetical protein
VHERSFCVAYNFVELGYYFALLIDSKCRVTHDIHEQDVRDLQWRLRHFFTQHGQLSVLVSHSCGKNFHGVVLLRGADLGDWKGWFAKGTTKPCASDCTIEGDAYSYLASTGSLKGHSSLAKQQTRREHYNEKGHINCVDGMRIGFRSRAAF